MFAIFPLTFNNPCTCITVIVSHRNLLLSLSDLGINSVQIPGAKLSTCMYGLLSSCYSGSCYLIVHLLLIWWPQTMKRNGILSYLYEPIWYFADANDSSCLYIGTWLFTIFSTLATEFAFLSQQWQWQNSQNIMNCWNCITSNI